LYATPTIKRNIHSQRFSPFLLVFAYRCPAPQIVRSPSNKK